MRAALPDLSLIHIFTLNTICLMGMVLAIGLGVDDAIVVVEAVESHMELGLAPRPVSYTHLGVLHDGAHMHAPLVGEGGVPHKGLPPEGGHRMPTMT